MTKKQNNPNKSKALANLTGSQHPQVTLEQFYKRYDWDVELILQKKAERVPVSQLAKDFGVCRASIYRAETVRNAVLAENGYFDPNSAIPIPNIIRLADSLGAGVEPQLQKGVELTNSWCLAMEMVGAKSTTMEYIPIDVSMINWATKKVKFGGEEYDTDLLVPDRKSRLEGAKILAKISGSQTLAAGMALEELEKYKEHQKSLQGANGLGDGATIGYLFPGSAVEIDAVIEDDVEEVETPKEEPKDVTNTKLF